jgi:hypothetical protein
MKDEALKMALAALGLVDDDIEWQERSITRKVVLKAITAIKQALALDKKAENARELGLDYEPCCKDQTCPKCKPAPVQEPVAWMYEVNGAHTVLDLFEPPDDAYDEGTLHPLYTAPPGGRWSEDCFTTAQRQWVEVEQVKWDGEKFIAKLKEKNSD